MKENNLKIMIVDDEKPIVDTLLMYFDRIGYNVKGYYNSVEALEVLKTEPYDIVFTDLKMPEVSGMDIVRHVKEQENDTVVIIFTGYATTDSAIEAIQYGVYDYIRKPFKLDEIRVVLDRAVEKLVLRRENIALHRKVERMLGQVTMLADITDILYQVMDFNEVSGMILDTITEGLDIPRVGIIGQDEKGDFTVLHHRHLPEDLATALTFRQNADLNGVSLGTMDAVTLDAVFEKGLQLNGREIWKADTINEMIFIPIRYLDRINGYVMVCDPDYSFFSREDTVQLFKILAVHIAPIFRSENYGDDNDLGSHRGFDKLLTDLMDAEIDLANKKRRSVTFSAYRLKALSALSENVDLSALSAEVKKLLQQEFGSKYDIIQQSYDSMLVIMPGANPLDTELSSASLGQEVETLFNTDGGKPMITLNYAYYTHMNGALRGRQVLNELNRLLANQDVPVD